MSDSDVEIRQIATDWVACGPIFPKGEFESDSLRKQVFEHIRGAGRVARSDIARALSVSAGSVTGITAELIASGLIKEVSDIDRTVTSRGRPPVALAVVADSFHVIGIHLADGRHTAILTDSIGTTLAETSKDAQASKSTAAALVNEAKGLIDNLLAKTGMALDRIAAIGVGLAGLVDHKTGIVSWSPLLTKTDVAFGEMIARRVRVPVFVDNDTNIVTLAELWFGSGRAKTNFAVMTVDHGVGMGLVLNNRLFRGAQGMGLELGHTKVQLGGALCRCGQRGCLEAYLADYALIRESSSAFGVTTEDGSCMTMDVLSDLSASGHPMAQAIFASAAKYLTIGLANIIQIFDPRLIILSGERSRYGNLNAQDLQTETHKLTLKRSETACEIVMHAWGGSVWARGAVALALSAATDKFTQERRQ